MFARIGTVMDFAPASSWRWLAGIEISCTLGLVLASREFAPIFGKHQPRLFVVAHGSLLRSSAALCSLLSELLCAIFLHIALPLTTAATTGHPNLEANNISELTNAIEQ
jgi:hypothetical protein